MWHWITKEIEILNEKKEKQKKEYLKILYKNIISDSFEEIKEKQILNYFAKKLDLCAFIIFEFYLDKNYKAKKIWIEFQNFELIENLTLYLLSKK